MNILRSGLTTVGGCIDLVRRGSRVFFMVCFAVYCVGGEGIFVVIWRLFSIMVMYCYLRVWALRQAQNGGECQMAKRGNLLRIMNCEFCCCIGG